MVIKSVRIQNLRTFADQTIPLDEYTCLVGPNGAGKSTVLCALNIFFRESGHSPIDLTCLEEQDFHNRKTDEPIKITVTFTDLSEEAQADLKDYFRNGELTVTAEATFDPETRNATVKHHGQRLAMKDFAVFFEMEKAAAKSPDLQECYRKLKEKYGDLPKATTKDAMRDALRTYEGNRPEQCELLPSPDQFYGVSKGTNLLEKYIQWVYVPAVKDAVSEEVAQKDTALGKLVARVVQSKVSFNEPLREIRENALKEYEKVVAQNQAVLADVSKQLGQLITQYAHPDATCRIAWTHDPEKSVRVDDPVASLLAGEGNFEGGVARFGHGLQRSLLLGLLQLVSGCGETSGPKLLLGVEEPELFQHPPQARYLSEVFRNLTEKNAQIVVSTHSPYFVTGKGAENVRLVRKSPVSKDSRVTFFTFAELSDLLSKATEKPAQKRHEGVKARLNQELHPLRNEIFFTPIVVLVEGIEDVAHITTYLHLQDKWNEFRRLGCHIVSADGKEYMIRMLAVMQLLKIPFFIIFDADGGCKPEHKTQHARDNKAILTLCGAKAIEPFPSADIWAHNFVMWQNTIADRIEADFAGTDFVKIRNEVLAKFAHMSAWRKNSSVITESLTAAHEKGVKSATLIKLCDEILVFAKKTSTFVISP